MIHGFPPAICAFEDARAVEWCGLENRCAVTPYYDRRARHHAGHEVRGPWPTPARDGIRAIVIEVALKYPLWGHRKIAWLARHEHALDVCDATCLRILREAGLTLPVDYVRERRDLAGARSSPIHAPPTTTCCSTLRCSRNRARAVAALPRRVRDGGQRRRARSGTACLLNADAELTKAAQAASGLLELAKISAAAGRTGASDLN